MVAIALNFVLVRNVEVEGIVFGGVWFCPVEGGVRNGNDFNAWEIFADTLNFVRSGWNVNRVALFSFGEFLHIFSIDNVILGEVIARSNNADNNSLKLVFVICELLIGQDLRNCRNSIIQIFAFDIDLGFLALWVFHRADNFFADILKMEVCEKLVTIIKCIFAGSAARVGD